MILLPEIGGPRLPPGATEWLYPAIQPAGRILVGVWLWREATSEQPLAGPAGG